MPPSAARACRNASRTSSAFETSQGTAAEPTPSAATSAATASRSAAVREDTATETPWRARSSATTRPIPRPPPVTRARFPESSFMAGSR